MPSKSAEPSQQRPRSRGRAVWAVVKKGVRAFRTWRRARPFWGGVFLVAGGIVILVPPYATFKLGDMVISIGTIAGVSSLVIGALLVVIGVGLWVRPEFRVVGAIAAGLLSLVSLVTANLGGFVIGMLLGLVGAALLLAWTDRPRQRRHRTRGRRATETKGAERS